MAMTMPVVRRGDEADEMPLERLEAEICELAVYLDAACARFLVMVAELDRRRGWADWGMRSCAHWLSWRCGLALPAARERVRVARSLEALPVITACFSSGELSYAKVRALTRVASPETEAEMVDLARTATASQLERLVRMYRPVRDAARAEAEEGGAEPGSEQPERPGRGSVEWHWDEDGSLVLSARLRSEDGALVLAALEAASATDEPKDVSAETSSAGARPSRPPCQGPRRWCAWPRRPWPAGRGHVAPNVATR